MLIPDIIINLKFLPTEHGGRKMPTPKDYFGCIFEIHNTNHDGRLLLDKIGSIYPSETKENVPVKFLCADLVIPKLNIGDKLLLKEGHVIGEAIVAEILNKNPESSAV